MSLTIAELYHFIAHIEELLHLNFVENSNHLEDVIEWLNEVTDPITIADRFASFESFLPSSRLLVALEDELLKDGSSFNATTIQAATSRRVVVELHSAIDYVVNMHCGHENRGIWHGVLLEHLPSFSPTDFEALDQKGLDLVCECLDLIVDSIEEDLEATMDATINAETAIVSFQNDYKSVKEEESVVLESELYNSRVSINIKKLENKSAQEWCEDAINDILSVIEQEFNSFEEFNDVFDDFHKVNRKVFSNKVLLESLVSMILGFTHYHFYPRYEDLFDALCDAKECLEDLDENTTQQKEIEEINNTCAILLVKARNAAACLTAENALHTGFASLVNSK